MNRSYKLIPAMCWVVMVAIHGSTWAQTSLPKTKAGANSPSKAAALQPAGPSGKGYRTGAVPSWVVEPPAPTAALRMSSAARREELVDVQVNFALPRLQNYLRMRSVAHDASALGVVSQPQITFNPAFQNVVLHNAHVVRDGRKLDRLRDARVELMRRETQLEKLVIDGTETLLVVLSDIRVAEPVEIAYTIEGSNPIFEGRISHTLTSASDVPVDLLHHRLVVPAERKLQVRALAGDAVPERSAEGKHQVLRLVRHHVPAVVQEQHTPPWFKLYPAWQVSEYESWTDVDAWAQRLFNPAQTVGPGVRDQAQALRATGLTGRALIAETLRFVQDEVRYFSVSLGESSHKPKSAERTLGERLGDCKDKVVLLNALLAELGFDAKPALVSVYRNRGIASFLPSSDHFDHVISRVEHDGRAWYLDATITGQGLTLEQRGHYAYGRALVVGAGAALADVAEPADAVNRIDHDQRWDFTKPGRPVRFTSTMRAHGLMAERWRLALAAAGEQRVVESIAGSFSRVAPGLKQVGAHELQDDRRANVLVLTLHFDHNDYGAYGSGGLDVEFGAVELLEVLNGPSEARRQTPYAIDIPRLTTSRIEVLTPRPLRSPAPPASEVADRHFRLTSRTEVAPERVVFTRNVERRADEVLPADLASYRETVLRARQQLGGRLRLMFVDPQSLRAEFARIDRRFIDEHSRRNDQLSNIVMRNEVARALDEAALREIEPNSTLAARAWAARASAGNLLGDFVTSFEHAGKALEIDPKDENALEAQAVALVGLGRMDEAMTAFARFEGSDRMRMARKWQGAIEVYRGRYAQAEAMLREVVDNGSGDDRDFALLWLFLAAEYQGSGRGRTAIANYVGGADVQKWVGALLHYFDGRIDREDLLRRARQNVDMERLNLAEAYFYIGQHHATRGQRDEALRWYTRTVETKAAPYREVTFAKLELQRPR
jgi:tetratricopeptide (TPR) repeat protein